MDLFKIILFIGSLVLVQASQEGCADGSTETLIADSWLSGCMGAWSGHIYNASHLCASGWRVCSWEDNRMLKKLKWEKASNVEGCFAYNAAQDSGGCGPCANHIDQDDMAGVGKDCPHLVEGERSCIGQGVISSSCCEDSRSNQACSYHDGITGVLCCRIPDKPPVIAQRFPTKETVKVGQNWTMNCPVVGNPHPAVDWLKDGRIIHESDRIMIHRETLRIQNVVAYDAGVYTCLAANTAGYAQEDITLSVSRQETKADIGCMDGSIDGLGHLRDVVACNGPWKGHVSRGKVHCSPGWRVCSNEDWTLLKRISWFDATGINGCYAYDAAVNGGKCSSCKEGSNHSMGGIGRHCSKRRKRQSSCLAQGRIDVYSPLSEGGQPSCDYQQGLISGVLCCKISAHKQRLPMRRKPGSKGKKVKCVQPCLNNGVCVGRNRCECPQGYKGASCQIPICDPPCNPGSYCLEPGVCACERGREAKCALREEDVAISLAKLERKCLRHCRNGGQCFQGHCFCPANTKGRFCQRVL
ncbi:Vascular endothelial growth factor receptor 3 [Holothuria leucospilota]|uniref:Vascular endothelial growth factor receptor 3 n=1 Tax=Holothuria leucospilota TaxID=206669 RepID=A0A9Q1BHW9_HOLLE|nr:Vascular endothelial growth factor receptor 3 [Holothuria leucospilota]